MTPKQRAAVRDRVEAFEQAIQYVFENPGKTAWVLAVCPCAASYCPPDIIFIPAVPDMVQ